MMDRPHWRACMDGYSGPAAAHPQYLLGGVAAGVASVYALLQLFPTHAVAPAERLVLVAKCMPIVGILFAAEMHCGVVARAAAGPKACFSPAGLEASGAQPFEIVQQARIHQNQIESFVIFLPSLFGVAAWCERAAYVPAVVISWVLARVAYHVGYASAYPMRRHFGMAWSLAVLLPGLLGGAF